MNSRVVEDLVGIRYAEEACRLLIGLCAESRYLEYLLACEERAVLVAVLDDILGAGNIDAGNIRKERI
jgi:hypothetical protein